MVTAYVAVVDMGSSLFSQSVPEIVDGNPNNPDNQDGIVLFQTRDATRQQYAVESGDSSRGTETTEHETTVSRLMVDG
jgi:hypothetical protein